SKIQNQKFLIHPKRRLPMLQLLGYPADTIGMEDYIPKPIQIKTLVQALSNHQSPPRTPEVLSTAVRGWKI
ncbi:MAG TPA: hypothetical protein DCL61_27340, partial [Cyanobacteria bacterium UBA12227]|nr:hypothetical protein [Cyanobacteria bacterium UBA12227]